jgi:hypothetical protein
MLVVLSLTRRNDSKPRISAPSNLPDAGCMPMENFQLHMNGILECSITIALMGC